MNTNEIFKVYMLTKDLTKVTDNMSIAGISSVVAQLLSSWAQEHDMDMAAVKIEILKTM